MSTTTITPYDTQLAGASARVAAERKLGQLQDELEAEYDEALALAGEYADHLLTGGDPTLYPQPHDRARAGVLHGIIRVAREAVFDTWNDSRDRRSVTYPWGQGMPTRWLVQEYLLDRQGTPVPLGELTRGTGRRVSPPEIAEAAWGIQVATRGELRVRKGHVNGKVVWLVRLAIPGDELADIGWRQGVHSGTSLTEEVVAAALEAPFKSMGFHEYPTEVM